MTCLLDQNAGEEAVHRRVPRGACVEARPGERVYMRVGDVFKDADIYSLDEWWPLAGLLSSVTMTDAKIRADDPSASCRNGYKPPDIVSAAPENINKCRCQMLKMPSGNGYVPNTTRGQSSWRAWVFRLQGLMLEHVADRSHGPRGASVGGTSAVTRIS